MKKFKETKAITLVALVITIIVLLILAGVTIATLGGNGNILSNANKAVEKYNNKTEQEEQILGTLEDKLKEYFGGETTTLEMEMPDNVIKANSMEYISPGSSYQLALKKSGNPVSASDVKWSSDNSYVQIDENGLLTLSDNAIYGNAVIKAEYQGETAEHLLVTLHRIKLGSNVETTQHQYSQSIKLFQENTFKVKDTLNLGIVPGEQGYTMIGLYGIDATEQTNYWENGVSIEKLAFGGTGGVANWSKLDLVALDLRNENISEKLKSNESDLSTVFFAGYEEGTISLPFKMYITVFNENGEFSERKELPRTEQYTNVSNITTFPIIGDGKYYVKIEFELPSWNNLTEEEMQNVLKLMSDDITYISNFCARIISGD